MQTIPNTKTCWLPTFHFNMLRCNFFGAVLPFHLCAFCLFSCFTFCPLSLSLCVSLLFFCLFFCLIVFTSKPAVSISAMKFVAKWKSSAHKIQSVWNKLLHDCRFKCELCNSRTQSLATFRRSCTGCWKCINCRVSVVHSSPRYFNVEFSVAAQNKIFSFQLNQSLFSFNTKTITQTIP